MLAYFSSTITLPLVRLKKKIGEKTMIVSIQQALNLICSSLVNYRFSLHMPHMSYYGSSIDYVVIYNYELFFLSLSHDMLMLDVCILGHFIKNLLHSCVLCPCPCNIAWEKYILTSLPTHHELQQQNSFYHARDS